MSPRRRRRGIVRRLCEPLGLSRVETVVRDPLGRRVDAWFGLSEDGSIGVVEVAAAIGLPLVGADERDPLVASSYGAGELVDAVRRAGARAIYVAAGGVATVDGGAGFLAALRAGGSVDCSDVEVLYDVRTPIEDAAATFGPQKGASPAGVRILAERMAKLAATLPRDPTGVVGGGAAGGLAAAIWAHGGRLTRGAERILDMAGFDQRLVHATLVVTGEGRLDRQTAEGKLVAEVASRAQARGVPVVAVVGCTAVDATSARELGLEAVIEAGTVGSLVSAGRRLSS